MSIRDMASAIAIDLRSLQDSEEWQQLLASLLRGQTQLPSDLRLLESSVEMSVLSRLIGGGSAPNTLEILEEFGKFGRYDERLHTRFLEFLLNPREKRHGLGDRFLKALLVRTKFFKGDQLKSIDLTGELADTKVIREQDSGQGFPDLKLRNERLQFLLLIENKVRANESPGQLKKYWEDAENQAPTFAIGGLFLTPDRRQATTSGKYEYGVISYGNLGEVLDALTEIR